MLLIFTTLIFTYFSKPSDSHTSVSNQTEELNIVDSWSHNYIGKLTNTSQSYSVKVAILDSGIYKEHEIFKSIKFEEFNAFDPSKKIRDDFGHGTAIAGIVASQFMDSPDSGNLTLYDVKVLDNKGSGEIENVIKGIEWCIEQEVDVINISFGYETSKEGLEQVISKALSKGIVIIAASGNNLESRVDFPAKYEEVLSISAFDKELNPFKFSGKGNVDFSAPGVDIVSSSNTGSYDHYTGTSFATAYTTAVVSKLLTVQKIENLNHLIDVLKKNYTRDPDELGKDLNYGNGAITFKGE